MCLLRPVASFIDDGKHFLFKACAAIYTIPMSARFDIVSIARRAKVAFDPAVCWHILWNDESSLLHAFPQSCWNNRLLNHGTLFHQMSHRITKPLPMPEMLIDILPACAECCDSIMLILNYTCTSIYTVTVMYTLATQTWHRITHMLPAASHHCLQH